MYNKQDTLIEKINRVYSMKDKLDGKDYQYEINDLITDSSTIIDGYSTSDWYIYIDNNFILRFV